MILIRVILIICVMCAVSITFILTLFDATVHSSYPTLMSVDWTTHVDVGGSPSHFATLTVTESTLNLTNTITTLQDKIKELEKQLESNTKELKEIVVATTITTSNASIVQNNDEGETSLQLPMCDDLMNQYDVYRDGSFLTRPTTEIIWKMRHDGSRELTLPHTCRLKRYTSTEAQQCLAGHHVAFVGDSLSRYLYLGLAYFLENNKYPARFGRRDSRGKCTHFNEQGEPQCTMHGEKNVCFEGTYKGWQDMYLDLGGGEDGGVFNGRMQCSCADLDRANTTEDSYTQSMHYVSDVQNDRGDRVKLTMLGEVGWYDDPSPLNLFHFNNCSYDGSCRHSLQHNNELVARAYNKSWDWSAPLKEALNSTLPKYFADVDITMYNRGMWNQIKPPQMRQLMQLFYDWSGREDGRCFYRSSTGSTRTRMKVHMLAEVERNRLFDDTVKAGCHYWDVAHVTREFIEHVQEHPAQRKVSSGEKKLGNWDSYNSLYWDAVHYSPWVYEELNNLFLNVLCNAK